MYIEVFEIRNLIDYIIFCMDCCVQNSAIVLSAGTLGIPIVTDRPTTGVQSGWLCPECTAGYEVQTLSRGTPGQDSRTHLELEVGNPATLRHAANLETKMAPNLKL